MNIPIADILDRADITGSQDIGWTVTYNGTKVYLPVGAPYQDAVAIAQAMKPTKF